LNLTFLSLFIHRLRGGSHQKSNLTSVAESHTSEMSVTAVRHVHSKTGNDSDSSIEHAIEGEQKVKGHVLK